MEKCMPPLISTTTVSGSAGQELIVTARSESIEGSDEMLAGVSKTLDGLGASVLSQAVFGVARSDAADRAARGASGEKDLENRSVPPPWPVTWVEEGCDSSPILAGTQVSALVGARPRSIRHDGRIVGTLVDDDDALYCRLGGLIPRDRSVSGGEQTRDILELMEEILQGNGFEFSHVVRTWFYNDRILSWYDEFNEARSTFFRERDLFSKIVPASTGVGGRNSARAALTSGLLAVRAKAGRDVRIEAVPSPQQCPALEYGSSFSRAVELTAGGLRRLYVSGTASIAPDGRTEYIGDVDGQVARTMDVVNAILESRKMAWADTVRAIVYFRNPGDAPRFVRYCSKNSLDDLPSLAVQNVICRDDLLFEIEIDAVQPL